MENSGSSQEAISKQWRPRQYVLVGMGVILAVSAVTIVTSIILRPSYIRFSVYDFSFSTQQIGIKSGAGVEEKTAVVFAFNLTAYNPSHRAVVVCYHILVSMQLQNHGGPGVRNTSVPANVTGAESIPQRKKMTMGVNAILDDHFFRFYSKNPSATIMIFVQVKFKVGLVRSRSYNIRASCGPIYYDLRDVSNQQSGIAHCRSAEDD